MTSVDLFLGRQYDIKNYNCLHFARDVWLELTGTDLTQHLIGLFDPDSRCVCKNHFRAFRALDKCEDPCIVLFQRDRREPHIGVFVRGKVLHLDEMGAHYQPLEITKLGFNRARYYSL